ncbi:MAG: two component transcriptional regulator, LuxR family [Verrucomicrobiales bacterium]|nr:two component transcriptional regulator, LuxR family [Verrucomicrobiales bacterium]
MKIETKKRILIVEDHPLYRDALCQLVNKEKDLVVCGDTGDRAQALKLVQETQPDMAIIDITLGQANGIELLKDIRALEDDLPVLIISMHDASLYAERGLRAGARGYVMKHEAPERIRAAIRQILQGGIAFTEQVMESLVLKMAEGKGKSVVELLSDRELEVFRLIGQGMGTRQIAATLHLSIPTINGFRARIKEKLKVSNGPELAFRAVRWAQQI